MTSIIRENSILYDQAGTGPTILVLHDEPKKQKALLQDCFSLTESNLRLVVCLIPRDGQYGSQVITLMKQLGIGRAVIIAIGTANFTLIELLEKHQDRIAAASFVAGKLLARDLLNKTANSHIHSLLKSGRRPSVAKALAKTSKNVSAYDTVHSWATKFVGRCRIGMKNCSGMLARLELPSLIQLDDSGDEEDVMTKTT